MQSRSVLIIDDDKVVLSFYKSKLSEIEGLIIFTVTSISDALQKIDSQDFFIIISDFIMPQYNGMQTLDLLKYIKKSKYNKNSLLVVVTSSTEMAESDIKDKTIKVLNKDASTIGKIVNFIRTSMEKYKL